MKKILLTLIIGIVFVSCKEQTIIGEWKEINSSYYIMTFTHNGNAIVVEEEKGEGTRYTYKVEKDSLFLTHPGGEYTELASFEFFNDKLFIFDGDANVVKYERIK